MPMPWMTRAASSIGTLCAKPAITEPMTKMTIALWTSTFLLNRSASLPQIGVDAALASSAVVMTQAYAVCDPFRSPMIVGSAVATIVRAQQRGEQRRQQAGHGFEDLAVRHRAVFPRCHRLG